MDYKLSDRARNLYLSGTSISAIAEYLVLDIKTVRKYINL